MLNNCNIKNIKKDKQFIISLPIFINKNVVQSVLEIYNFELQYK